MERVNNKMSVNNFDKWAETYDLVYGNYLANFQKQRGLLKLLGLLFKKKRMF